MPPGPKEHSGTSLGYSSLILFILNTFQSSSLNLLRYVSALVIIFPNKNRTKFKNCDIFSFVLGCHMSKGVFMGHFL